VGYQYPSYRSFRRVVDSVLSKALPGNRKMESTARRNGFRLQMRVMLIHLAAGVASQVLVEKAYGALHIWTSGTGRLESESLRFGGGIAARAAKVSSSK
jgi:hypothetical protein